MDPYKSLFPAKEDLRTALLKYMVANEKGTFGVAVEFGMRSQTVTNFLNGEHKPSFKTLLKLARSLGFDLPDEKSSNRC